MATNPTPSLGVQNWYQDTLSSAIAAGDTTIPINNLPSPSEGYLIIDPDNASTREVIHYNSKTGSAVVCPSSGDRGLDGTTAQSHAQNTTVRMEYTSSHFTAVQNGFALGVGALATVQTFASNLTLPTIIKNPYKFSVYLTTDQTITANQWNKVGLNTRSFDTSSNFDITTNFQFTAPIAGFYQFNAAVRLFGLADTGLTNIGLNVNAFSVSPTYIGGQVYAGANSVTMDIAMAKLIKLNANDTVQLYTASGSGTITSGSANTWLDGFLVSAT